MAYDIIRRKMTQTNLSIDDGSSVSGMGADAMEVAQALRNPAVTDAQAAAAIKKGTFKGGLKIGAASAAVGVLVGYFIRGRR
jgi:hypothetical protein